MTPPMIVLIAMTVVVAALAIYRKAVAYNEDDFLHVNDASDRAIQHQVKTDRNLQTIDRIGIAMTVLTALYGLALLGFYLYSEFQQRGRF